MPHANKIDTATEIDMELSKNSGKIINSNVKEMAELKTERGNLLYKGERYQQAVKLFTEAIELCPDSSTYYGNRSACYINLYQYEAALEDARKAVALDPSFVNAYMLIAKCSLALGDLAAVNSVLSTVRELSLNNSAFLPQVQKLEGVIKLDTEATIACEKRDYIKAVFCMDQILELIPCTRYKLKNAGCLILLGRYQEARNIANDILRVDKENADAIYVRGISFYYQDNMEQAFCHFEYALRLAPNHQRAMNIYKRAKALVQRREEGNKAYTAGRYKEAYAIYTYTLQIEPNNNSVNAKLFFSRATVCSKLGRFDQAVADYSSALKLDENYRKALLQRAKCYMKLREFDKAISDYEKVFKMDKSRESERLLENAKQALEKSKGKDYYQIFSIEKIEKSKGKDYYQIFSIEKNASLNEIKKAYKRRALDHHPDRHVTAPDSERREHEEKFKEAAEAYGILSDMKKRACYDRSRGN
jgi:DnaJ family protein C protein 7